MVIVVFDFDRCFDVPMMNFCSSDRSSSTCDSSLLTFAVVVFSMMSTIATPSGMASALSAMESAAAAAASAVTLREWTVRACVDSVSFIDAVNAATYSFRSISEEDDGATSDDDVRMSFSNDATVAVDVTKYESNDAFNSLRLIVRVSIVAMSSASSVATNVARSDEPCFCKPVGPSDAV